jgi:hypothetical protein
MRIKNYQELILRSFFENQNLSLSAILNSKKFDNSVYKLFLNQNFNEKGTIYIINNYFMGQASAWSR